MCLDIGDEPGLDARRIQRLANYRFLGSAVRGGQAGRAAILIDRGAADHCEHAVAIGQRVGQPLHHDDPATFAAHIAVGVGIEGLATSVRRSIRPWQKLMVMSGVSIRLTPAISARLHSRLRRL